MSTSEWIIDVAESDFEQAILERSRERPVVVDFWAPWCAPCRMLGPILEKLVNERNGEVILARVNIDEAQGLAAEFGVEAIPMVVALRDATPVLHFTGLLSEEQLRDFLDRLRPSEADQLLAQARMKEETAPAEAEALYRKILEQDANLEAANIGLARLLLARGADAEANELLERIGAGDEVEKLQAVVALRQLGQELGDEATIRKQPDADSPRRQYELGCVLAAAGKYPEALATLLSAAERDSKLASTAVREAMVKVFRAIGVRDPLADEYRDKLARLLY